MKNLLLNEEPDVKEHVVPTIMHSKDTLDIQTSCENGPLKSCILISRGDGTDERISVKKAKSVQFADTLGKPLKSVKTLADSPDDLFGVNFLSLRSTTRRSFQIEPNIFQQKEKIKEKENEGECVNFKNALEFPELEARVENEKVCLKKVTFIKGNGIFGTIVVKNLCFEKHVSVVYTYDNWKTQEKEVGKYVSLSEVKNADVFSFEIVPKQQCNVSSINLTFAICFTANDKSYWDSNCGNNYSVLFKIEKQSEYFSLSENKTGFILPMQKNCFNMHG